MAGGRSGPALFELLRDKTGTSGASRQQAAAIPVMPVRPEAEPEPELPAPPPMPVVKPPADPERPRAWVTERGGPAAAAMDLGRAIPVTTYAIGLAVAGVLGLTVLVGALAYKSGYRTGERDTLKGLGLAGPTPVRDPLKNPIPVNPNLLPQPTGRTAAPPKPAGGEARPPDRAPAAGPAAGRIPDGTDPRTPGLNYLLIAGKVDGETAERMVGFLNENGVQAFRVARGGSGAKNPGSFTVYALPGITPEQFKARTPERNQLQEMVTRLGKRWQKEQKGQTDFATAYWEKYGS